MATTKSTRLPAAVLQCDVDTPGVLLFFVRSLQLHSHCFRHLGTAANERRAAMKIARIESASVNATTAIATFVKVRTAPMPSVVQRTAPVI